MHDVDAMADPLAVLLTIGLVLWAVWTVASSQIEVRRERMSGISRERQRLEALKRAAGW